MSGEKSQDLYRALDEIDPVKAPEIVHKYAAIMEGIDNALIYGDGKVAQDARDHLDMITDDLIYEQQRADLIEPFEQELDIIAESLGIAISVPTDIEVSDERPVGFAERYRESELREIFDSYSSQEWQGIIDTMLEEGAEALDIPKERQYRVEQLNAIIIALEAIKRKIEESRGVGEDFSQLFQFDETTKSKAQKISLLIDYLKERGIKEIVQNGLTVEQFFLKYNDEFGDKVKDILRSHSETEAFLDRYGRMVDVTDEGKKKEYYLALVKFLRDQQDYQTAQNILEEIMDEEFQSAIDFIPGDHESTDTSESNIKGRLYDKADAKVGKLVTDKVITQWRREGMTREQIEDSKRNLKNMHYERLLHEYAAEHILVGDLHSAGEGMHVAPLDGHKAFWEQYNDMLDPKGEAFNLTDESWDMIFEELVYTAPLIIVSGGVAGAVAKGLSIGARAALAATRMATWGARLARGGRIARGALRLGRLSAQGTSLIAEGAVFELTFEGIQGELIFAQEDWVKKILWTSVALGLFKGAGKLGGKGATALNRALAEYAPKLANKNLVQLINKLVIIGHTQVAAMLLLSGIQHMAAGEFEEFWNNFGYQIFHAYVTVGSLNVAHGVINTAKGVVFRPKGGAPATSEAPKKAGEPKRTLFPKSVTDAMGTKASQTIEVSRGKDLTEAMETLQRKGFEFEIMENGEVLARKGDVEIHLQEKGALARESARHQKRMAKYEKGITKDPALRRRFEALKSEAKRIIDEILAIAKGGSLKPEHRMSFLARLSLVGTAIITFLAPKTAKANPLTDLWNWAGKKTDSITSGLSELGDSITSGLGELRDIVVHTVTFGISVGLIYGTVKTGPSMAKVWRLLHLPNFAGLYLSHKFGSVGERLTGRTGTLPGDVAARTAGQGLRDVLNGLHHARRISEAIRKGLYEFGPLKELAGNLTETGDRILEILERPYGEDDVFPQAEFDGLVQEFTRHSGTLRNNLTLKPRSSLKIGLSDMAKLIGYVAFVQFAAWWFLHSKKDEKKDGGYGPGPGPGGYGPGPAGGSPGFSPGGFGPPAAPATPAPASGAPSGAPSVSDPISGGPNFENTLPSNLKGKGFYQEADGTIRRKGKPGTYEINPDNSVIYTRPGGEKLRLPPNVNVDSNWPEYKGPAGQSGIPAPAPATPAPAPATPAIRPRNFNF